MEGNQILLTVFVVVGVLVVNVLLWLFLMTRLKKLVNTRLAELRKRYPDRDVLLIAPTSNLIGRESPSGKMLRGNGTALLTRDKLVFELWLPKTELLIPRNRIKAVSEVKAFAGKSIMRPLLRVDYRNEQGEDEALALYLPDHGAWKTKLEA